MNEEISIGGAGIIAMVDHHAFAASRQPQSPTVGRPPDIASVIDSSRAFDNSLPDGQQASKYAHPCA